MEKKDVSDYAIWAKGLPDIGGLYLALEKSGYFDGIELDRRTSTLFVVGLRKKFSRDFFSILKRYGSPTVQQVEPNSKDPALRMHNLKFTAFLRRKEAESKVGEGYTHVSE